jgi:hypothetical protein
MQILQSFDDTSDATLPDACFHTGTDTPNATLPFDADTPEATLCIDIIRGVLGNKCAGQHNLKTLHFKETIVSAYF